MGKTKGERRSCLTCRHLNEDINEPDCVCIPCIQCAGHIHWELKVKR